jgi:hypothetical protein
VTEAQASTIRTGDPVRYGGEVRRVNAIKTSGIAAPYFSLEGVEDGLTSYRLCGFLGEEADEPSKPMVKLTGTDGNVFALLGRCSAALKRAGRHAKAEELRERVMGSKSYDEALSIMLEYVDAS